MNCSSPPPPLAAGTGFCCQMPENHILNMSPRPSHHLNPACSSAELVKEIAMLEVQIAHLECYLLSLYRTAFQQYLPNNMENNAITHVQQITGNYPFVMPDQPTKKMELRLSKEYDDQVKSSPTSALAGLNDLFQVATSKSSSGTENKSDYFQHRSLADHLGNSQIGNAICCPDRLSEDIIRCISSIYYKLGYPSQAKGYSVSSTSSFCSSSTFSPRIQSGSWSPQCNDEVTELCDSEGRNHDNGAYTEMVEVLRIYLDDESYSYAAAMLQKLRSLVKNLENVDLKKMRREQKLAFWINIHNALVMHAYLAFGTQNYIKSTCIMKASYNVGGRCVNAYDIQSYIFGIKSHYSSTWLQTILSPGKFKNATTKHVYAIEYPEPLVHFALCSGAYSDPVVRVYSAKSIFQDLNIAKEEFIQATVYVHKQTKIYLPKILQHYAKDMSLGVAALLEVVSECLPIIQQKAIRKFSMGRPEKHVYWSEQTSSFRYLIHKETAQIR